MYVWKWNGERTKMTEREGGNSSEIGVCVIHQFSLVCRLSCNYNIIKKKTAAADQTGDAGKS